MNKIIIFLLGLAVGVVLPLYAWKMTDESNMAKPVVRVLDQYPGAWRGWEDGCIGCYKPLASAIPETKRRSRNKQQAAIVAQRNAILSAKIIRKLSQGVFCECNCNTPEETKMLRGKPKKPTSLVADPDVTRMQQHEDKAKGEIKRYRSKNNRLKIE